METLVGEVQFGPSPHTPSLCSEYETVPAALSPVHTVPDVSSLACHFITRGLGSAEGEVWCCLVTDWL